MTSFLVMKPEMDDEWIDFDIQDWGPQQEEPGLWEETWDEIEDDYTRQLRQELDKISKTNP